jgi:hypothetical protein
VSTAQPSVDQLWARNYVGSFDSGGVIVEIVRVLVGYKSSMPSFDWDAGNDFITGWAETEVVGELIFRLTNATERTVSIYPDQGTVQIGSEQIELFDYFSAAFGEDVSGELFAGVVKVGGIWFGIRRSLPADVTQVVFRCNGPVDASSWARVGPDIEIVMDVTTHVWEDVPEEINSYLE